MKETRSSGVERSRRVGAVGGPPNSRGASKLLNSNERILKLIYNSVNIGEGRQFGKYILKQGETHQNISSKQTEIS